MVSMSQSYAWEKRAHIKCLTSCLIVDIETEWSKVGGTYSIGRPLDKRRSADTDLYQIKFDKLALPDLVDGFEKETQFMIGKLRSGCCMF